MRHTLVRTLPYLLSLPLSFAIACGDDDMTFDGGPMMDGGIDVGPDFDGGPDFDAGPTPDGGTPDGGPGNDLFPPVTITECGDVAPISEGICEASAGNDARLITADVLLPGEVLRGGQVLVGADGTIACVACDCSGEAAATGATTLVCPDAVVSPGLINGHDHVTFGNSEPYGARGDQTDERYEHRHDWRRGLDGHSRVPSGGGRARTEEMQWLELRQLMSGTTSINGSGGPAGLLRNLDNNGRNGLSLPAVDYSTFPLGDSGGEKITAGCGYDYSDGADDAMGPGAYAPHVAEGIDEAARNEFRCVSMDGDRDLVQPASAFIHGTGLTASDINVMAVDGTKLIWSARTNITLYGDTARVTEYARQGVTIALGTDWLDSGSMHMGRELACVDSFNQNYLDGFFPDDQLWLMATANGALAMGVETQLGTLAVGYQADLAIYDASEHADYRAVLMADEGDVALVMRGGDVLYGDEAIVNVLSTGCDGVDVCGASKSVCLMADIGSSFAALSAANGGAYPLFACNAPENEPSCVPARVGDSPAAEVNGSNRYSGMSMADDMDGDGIVDADDNCAAVFNPIRPLDNNMQADFDADGFGDACDACPLGGDEDPATCNAVDPNDRDNDTIPNDMDNCPSEFNTDQEDMDMDGQGDACDACPARANPGGTACPATVYEVRDGTFGEGATVRVSELVVTGIASNGFYAQLDVDSDDYVAIDFSGIFVFTGGAPTVALGDNVAVDGAVSDFFGQDQIASTGVSVTSSGTVVDPLLVTVAEIETMGARAEALEGALVRVEMVNVIDGELTRADTFIVSGGLRVGDQLFDLSPAPGTGDELVYVQGPLNFSFEHTRIVPRGAGDLVYAALRIGPNSVRAVQGSTFELTVSVPTAAPVGGMMVPVAIVPADLIDMGPTAIMIAEGEFVGSATFTAGATVQDGTITASFGGSDAVAMVSVTEPFSGGLIISEYVEGSSNNKALELYNGSAEIDLAANNCVLRLTTNGDGSNRTLELTGTLGMGDTLVICNPSADVPDAVCDIRDTVINHNGNDPYVIECDGMVVDSFGQIGPQPDGFEAWTGGGVSSRDQSLRRRCDVAGADTDPSDAFDPSLEYDTFPQNTFDGLGEHCL
ncbi:MAG: amidohydrolase family protein [Polyangiales bacterium]